MGSQKKLRFLISFSFLIILGVTKPSSSFLAPIAARLPLPGTPAKPGSPWPMPEVHVQNPNLATIASRDLTFTSTLSNCSILNSIFSRYDSNLLFRDIQVTPGRDLPLLTDVQVILPHTFDINLCQEYPQLNTDPDRNYERYSINIKTTSDTEAQATITSSTIWGAIRGIETFSQLIWKDAKANHFYVNFTEILDAPRFPHRGLLIDTARHYVSLEIIETVLDAMSFNKLNVLHWHIVDDQSFPFVSNTFPNLSLLGAYLPELTYEAEEVQGIIEYARDRGIRVVLEFDTPGHTQGFAKAYPQLLTPCYGDGVNPGTPDYPNHAAYEILDPTKNFTYEFMRDFFTEIKSVSKDSYVHLGMDEVYYKCWESSPEIKKFMEENNFTEYYQLLQHYTVKHLNAVSEIGLKPIIWHDPIEYGLLPDKDVLIQVWKGGDWIPYFERVLKAGYKALLSSCWYLNYISYGQTWRNYYECDPIVSLPNITDAEKGLILGGEAVVFGEYADSTNLVQIIFPFVGAVAERLWSPEFPINTNITDDAMHRLDQHRCRMLWRGIPAQPIFNGYCFAEEKPKKRLKGVDLQKSSF